MRENGYVLSTRTSLQSRLPTLTLRVDGEYGSQKNGQQTIYCLKMLKIAKTARYHVTLQKLRNCKIPTTGVASYVRLRKSRILDYMRRIPCDVCMLIMLPLRGFFFFWWLKFLPIFVLIFQFACVANMFGCILNIYFSCYEVTRLPLQHS